MRPWQAKVIQPHVQTCLGRLLMLQKGWNVCDNISWHLFMWRSESVNATCCRLSKGQRWPWRDTGMFESWHFMTIHDKRDDFRRCVCWIFRRAVTCRLFLKLNISLKKHWCCTWSIFTVDEHINICQSQSLLTSVIKALFTLFISNGGEIKYTEHSVGPVTDLIALPLRFHSLHGIQVWLNQ